MVRAKCLPLLSSSPARRCSSPSTSSTSSPMKEAFRYLTGIAGPSGFGSNSTAEEVVEGVVCSSNLTAIITGATSGIGAETARVLAKKGVRLVLAARNLKRAAKVRERIQGESPGSEILVLEMDLSSFASIQRFCSQFLSLDLPLNILINNAGKYGHNWEVSEDNFELTFATNYLGHFLLTENLVEMMVKTAGETGIEGRIINVSSVIHSWVKKESFRFNDMLRPHRYLQMTQTHSLYNGTRAYAQSKLANILHAKELARQLCGRGANVTINALHPGIVKTGIIRDHKGLVTDSVFFLASKLLKSTAQGASTTCFVALSTQTKGITGKYFADCNECPCSSLAEDKSAARKLWRRTTSLVRIRLWEMNHLSIHERDETTHPP